MSAIGQIQNLINTNQVPPIFNVSWTADDEPKSFWLLPTDEFNYPTDIPILADALAGVSGITDVAITKYTEDQTTVYP